MALLKWDLPGEHFYETGVEKAVLYVSDDSVTGRDLKYAAGVAWNGITAITNSPSGAEETALYADDDKYLSMRSKEDFGATIEAYTYPDEWYACDGLVKMGGVAVSQQARKSFCLSYVTKEGNDTEFDSYGEKIHIIYGASASPSEKAYSTVNDSPEAITFSWEIATIPVDCKLGGTELKKCAHLEVSSTDFPDKGDTAGKWQALKDALWGTDASSGYGTGTDPMVLSPEEVYEILNGSDSE